MRNESALHDPGMKLDPNYQVSDQDKFTSIVNILRGSEEFTLNAEGIIISSNLEAVTITGYEEWEVIGKHFSLFYTLEDRALDKPAEDLDHVARKSRLNVLGWRLKKRNASFWARIKMSVIKDHTGIVLGYRLVLRDATHKAMSNYRVKRIRSEYLNLFNNSFIGIFKFRLDDCRVLLFNEKALEIFGKESVDQLYFEDLFADAEEFEIFLQTISTRKKIIGYDFRIAHTGTDERWASISCSYFGEGHFVEGVINDITESKRQVLELQRLNHELDQFIYHASHDLRSPLTTVLGLINLIELDKPTRAIGLYTGMLKERIQHLDTLLKDLVNITLNGKSELESEVIVFEEEVQKLLNEFQQQYQNVEVYLETEKGMEFYSDPIRFRTVLRNLISNALKYHNVHATPPYLKIQIRSTGGNAYLTFEDNGIGIDDEHVPKIFNMFYRATPKAHGTGLGLYIVQQMVDKLGGSIKVHSARGKGTTFTLELPNRHQPTLRIV